MALLSVLVQTLAEQGPNPIAFHASPAADFICDGRVMRTAPGWWVASACLLEVTSASVGDDAESVLLSFTGEGVQGGEPWAWRLTYESADQGGRRLVLRDFARYPNPLLNALQYHATRCCREALLQRTASRLGHRIGHRQAFHVAAATVLTMVGLTNVELARSPARHVEGALMPREAHEYMDSQAAELEEEEAGDVMNAKAANVTAFRVLDETPRPGNTAFSAGFQFGQDDCGLQSSAHSLAAAEAFAASYIPQKGSISSQASETIESEHGEKGLPPLYATPSSLEDRVDALRAQMPHRSTETLRKLVHQDFIQSDAVSPMS